jgi:hypothetical protein
VLPGHVQTVDDAYFWIRDWIDGLGGIPEPEPIRLDMVFRDELPRAEPPEDEDEDDPDPTGVKLSHTRIYLGDKVLSAGLLLRDDLSFTYYSFDLRHSQGALIWRHDFHGGHEDEDGTRHHRHEMRDGVEVRVPEPDPPSLEDIATAATAA